MRGEEGWRGQERETVRKDKRKGTREGGGLKKMREMELLDVERKS